MNLQKIYTALLTADLAAAEGWYAKLLGRGPDRRLQGLGIVLGNDIEGDYSTLAQVRDPDGNLLTLATPPSRPFPPA